MSFEDGGVLLDGVNERLLTQDRHYVNLSRGSIPAAPTGQGAGEVSYQRLCIPLDDGGLFASLLLGLDSLDSHKSPYRSKCHSSQMHQNISFVMLFPNGAKLSGHCNFMTDFTNFPLV
ncbi:hypothetical protein ZWY2020_005367 [Hordeum vulgare]|nr:hypothetical protein ZWY2020_005367 [Hordeum vulgare]